MYPEDMKDEQLLNHYERLFKILLNNHSQEHEIAFLQVKNEIRKRMSK